MKKKKQQKQIHSFFARKAPEPESESAPHDIANTDTAAAANEAEAAADKENTVIKALPTLDSFVMGCKSQDRKSAIQRAKERTFSIQNALREAKSKNQKIKTKNPQRKLDGTIAEPRCDDPDNPRECMACTKKEQYRKRGKEFKGFAHHYSCPHNKEYFDHLFGPKSESASFFDAEAKKIAKKNNQPLPGPDLHVRKEDGVAFFSPRNRNSTSDAESQLRTVLPAGNETPVPTELMNPAISTTEPPPPSPPSPPVATVPAVGSIESQSPPSDVPPLSDPFEVQCMKTKIRQYMENPSTSMKRGKTIPNVIGAAIEALMELSPRKFKSGTNAMMGMGDLNSATAKRYHTYKKRFKPGTLGFTFPKADITEPPDEFYSLLEGVTIYLVSWETNIPGIELSCSKCSRGEMIHQKYDWTSHGYATPVFDISGKTDWAASMQYQCNCCSFKCKGNDGRMLATLKPEVRMSYPVDARYATGETHMSLTTTRVVDDLMVTHGNGDQISRMLHRMRGLCYEDIEEKYYSSCINHKTAPTVLPPFEKWIALHGPSGTSIRDAKDDAFHSNLTCTAVSDKERFDRELQGIGARVAAASDATFEATKSYMKGKIETGIMHTINQEDGQLASVALVPTLEQADAAHQIEQFSLRPNVTPKVHYSDTCPSGIALWKSLFGTGIICRLGLFHFQQRIIKTLTKECQLCVEAIAALQECVYWYDTGDLEKVVQCMEDGTLGVRHGNKVPADQRKDRAKSYRQFVRIYTYDAGTIGGLLEGWLRRYGGKKDKIGVPLFKYDTVKVVRNQIQKAVWVVDVLGKDALYYPVEAGIMSKSGLPKWIGMRGVESKLEKIHHLLAHFANTGMRTTLADSLIMAGVALYNLSIRYRLRINKLSAAQRAEVPVAFHRAPAFTNHLKLAYINALARKAGAAMDVHVFVEETIPNNGEKFLSEYLFDQVERKLKLTPQPKTKRCMCEKCGSHPDANKRSNPYLQHKKRPPPALEQAPPALEQAPVFFPQPAIAMVPPPVNLYQPQLNLYAPSFYGFVPIATSNQGSYSEIMKKARLE